MRLLPPTFLFLPHLRQASRPLSFETRVSLVYLKLSHIDTSVLRFRAKATKLYIAVIVHFVHPRSTRIDRFSFRRLVDHVIREPE